MRLPLLLAASFALAAWAPVNPPEIETASEPSACFLVQRVTNFSADGRQSVYIRTLGDEVFRLDACPGLQPSFQLGLDTGPGSFSRVCEGDIVHLTARGVGSDVQSCRAVVGPRLTEAQVAALPARDRP